MSLNPEVGQLLRLVQAAADIYAEAVKRGDDPEVIQLRRKELNLWQRELDRVMEKYS